MSVPTRRSPGTKSRATSTTPIAGIDLTALLGHERQNGYSAPDAEDRADLDVLIAAAERGFRLAVRCRECGRFLTAPSSVRDFIGPRCRERVAS